jgi:hypothetical protein
MVSKRLTGTGDSSFAIYSQTPDIAKRLAVAITLADGRDGRDPSEPGVSHMDRGSGRISVVTA